jgi:hypothetical protein
MATSSPPDFEGILKKHEEHLVATLQKLISAATRETVEKVSALHEKVNALEEKVVQLTALEVRIIEHFRAELGPKFYEVETTIIENLRREISGRLYATETSLIDQSRREFAARLQTAETAITAQIDAKLDAALGATETKLDGQFQTQLDDGLKSLQKNLIVSLAPRQLTPTAARIKKKEEEVTELEDVQKEATDKANNEKNETVKKQWEAIAKRVGQLADVARTELEALIY